ncbi:MAG: hypothetical protein US86_C0006G0034 [Candidatus Daviesbacteria bacterium GW2011_GWA2_38_24]|uniref:NAD-dependent epimerase/dehydratase domain-containing protein n=1 Tax=Candidatus Daviesbacteria bacterium GW2011_GWA2_38_24 TaxID=1618422 RepID=A0A0G0LY79_9BACT|nr:MAG: hypothetical protein US86_C0006G0034 [Candidatus Daviesbacteria bacterium GW2011_GWA2_38_24]
MKCLVTGGAGFIGSHIVDALVAEGYDVHIVDNLSSGKKENVNPKATLHQVDIRDKEKLIPIFKDVQYVFHEAALPRVQYSIENPIETNEVNVTGTLNVLEASRLNNVKRIIYAASSSAYGDSKILPVKETFPPNPLSPYGAQKYIGEVYVKVWAEVYKLETVSLRYFNVYGPRLNPEGAYPLAIGYFLKSKKEGRPLTVTGDGKQTRDFTNVSDVVKANLLAMKSDRVGNGEVINIGGGHRQSINSIAELIGGKIEYVAPRIEPHDTEADITHAKELLEWEPRVSLKEGLEETKVWFEKQNY